jgi:hypothetical protein
LLQASPAIGSQIGTVSLNKSGKKGSPLLVVASCCEHKSSALGVLAKDIEGVVGSGGEYQFPKLKGYSSVAPAYATADRQELDPKSLRFKRASAAAGGAHAELKQFI